MIQDVSLPETLYSAFPRTGGGDPVIVLDEYDVKDFSPHRRG